MWGITEILIEARAPFYIKHVILVVLTTWFLWKIIKRFIVEYNYSLSSGEFVATRKLGRKEKAEKTATEPVKVAPPAPVAESAPAPVAASDDGAIVAAITAAISAQLASEGFTGGFRVVSFKRSGANTQKRA